MTPSRGAANFADSVVGGRWRIALLFPLLLCATHGFLLAPPPPSAAGGFSSTGSGSDLGRAAGAGQQCSCRPLARRTASVRGGPPPCRLTAAIESSCCVLIALRVDVWYGYTHTYLVIVFVVLVDYRIEYSNIIKLYSIPRWYYLRIAVLYQ